jgi:hypothetical protein
MEAELVALDTATVEVNWLCELLMDLPIVEIPLPAILMNCDNQTVIVIKTHQKTVEVYQKNEKLTGYYVGLHPY